MKARIFSLLLIVALLVSVSVFAVEAADLNINLDFSAGGTVTADCPACGTTAAEWVAFQGCSAYYNGTRNQLPAGHYYLPEGGITNTSYYSVSANVCLHLNGQTLSSSGIIMSVSGGTVNIIDNENGAGKLLANSTGGNNGLAIYGGTTNLHNVTVERSSEKATSSARATYGPVYMNAGTLNVHSGTVINGCYAGNGGAVYLNKGTLNLEGGTIVGGNVSTNGGAVNVQGSGVLNVNSGNINGGTAATYGGSVCVIGGKLNINGGKIIGGSAPVGGAVHMHGGTAIMSTGSIEGGTATSGSAGTDNANVHRGGGAVCVWNGASFTMNGGTIQGTKAGYSGGSVMVSTNNTSVSTFNFNGGTIKAATSNTARGGAVSVAKSCVLNIGMTDGSGAVDSAVIIKDETGGTSTNGNLIFNQGGIINIYKGALLSGGQATGVAGNNGTGGGAIYNVTLVTGTGDAAVTYTASITMHDGKIENSSSPFGAINNNAAFTMNGGTISGGTATELGGNVYHRGNTFTMEGGTITGGTAVDGGNVYVAGGTFKLEGGSITNGTVSGTTVADDASTADVDESANSVNGKGGNVYNKATFTMGLAEEDAALVEGYVAPTISGGKKTDAGQPVNGANVYTEDTFNLVDGIISGGVSTANGGNVFVSGGVFDMTGGKVTGGQAVNGGNFQLEGTASLKMSGGEISDAVITTQGAGINNVSTSDEAVVISGKALITNNKSTGNNGGNIHSTKGLITISGGTIQTGQSPVYGGNICLNGAAAKLNFTGGTIQNGTAGAGGNIFMLFSAQMTMSGTAETTKILGGSNTGYQGGSISIRGGTFNLQGGIIDATDGSCATNGGAVSVGWSSGSSAAEFNMTGGTIQNGTATNGGNVYVFGVGNFVMNGGTITGGSATDGGNVYVAAGTFDMDSGNITSGTATTNGGSVYVAAGTFDMVGGTIGGATVEGETVTSLGGVAANNGGNVYMAGGEFTMTGGTISYGSTTKTETAADGSIASHSGGGNIFIGGGTFTLNGDEAKILNGTTNVDGGNVYVAKGTFTLTKGEVADGTATYELGNGLQGGGNIYATSGNAIVNINGGKVYGGYAKRGGNIGVFSGAKLTVEDGATITASDEIMSGCTGVNIFNRLSTVTINGGIIDGGTNTTVTTTGRLIYAHSGTLNLSGGKLINGMRNGTGVYLAVTNTTAVNLSGDAEVGQLVIASSKEPPITIASDYTGSVFFRFFTASIHDNMDYGVALPTYITVTEGYANTASLFTGSKNNGYMPVAYGDITGDGVAELYVTKLIKNVEGTMIDTGASAGTSDIPKTVGIHAVSEVQDGEALSFATDAGTVELPGDMTVDSNGQDVTLTAPEGTTITLIDTANDNFSSTPGAVTVGEGVTVETYVTMDNGNRYITLENNDGTYSAHRIEARLHKVSIRPKDVGVYYSVEINCDSTLEKLVVNYGVAMSVNSMPDDSFLGDGSREDILYTYLSVNDQSFQSGEYHGALLTGIMTTETIPDGDPTNAERAGKPVYANAYVVILDGNLNQTLVMADEVNMNKTVDDADYDATTAIDFSLTEIMTEVNEKETFDKLTDTAKNSVQKFYNDWKEAAEWTFTTIENWVKEA